LPIVRTLAIVQGAAKTVQVTVLDDNENVADLTGSKLLLTVKDQKNVAIITKSSMVTGQITILDQSQSATRGKANIIFVSADTKTRPPGAYQYDMWIILPDNSPKPLVQLSTFEIKPSVTALP
jgi:hypothetical protein